MDVTFAFLCDYADNTGGKLTAVGAGFDTIYAQEVPAVHSLFFSVVRLRFTRVEIGEKRVRIHIQDADGGEVIPPVDTVIRVAPPPQGYTHRTQTIVLAVQGASFPRYGDYQLSWVVDGHEAMSIPLKVAPPLPPSA